MENIKKIFAIVLFMTSAQLFGQFENLGKAAQGAASGAAQGVANDLLGKSIGELVGMSAALDLPTDICFTPKTTDKTPSKLGLCDYVRIAEREINDLNICAFVPNPDEQLFEKKKYSLSTNGALTDFCEDRERSLTSAISDIDIYIKNAGSANNQSSPNATRNAYDMLKKEDSVVYGALYANNQKIIREVYLRAQKGNSSSVADIELKDLSAPADYATYLKEVSVLTDESMTDYIEYSPTSISSQIRSEVSSIEDAAEATKKAAELAKKASSHIDRGTDVRTALYIDALARDDDFAVPTQEMINVLRKDKKAESIAKIKQQQKREALIRSEIKQIDEARKRLLDIGGKKAAIISRKFNAAEAKANIDKLVDGGGSGGSGSIPSI
ncbi:MAG: hypothetical protein LBJ88_04160 [Campylobacteraceae bacterium]|jgi:hypothetical protein|nr:hypothetical protein [Campylobacteraceae bacterium]